MSLTEVSRLSVAAGIPVAGILVALGAFLGWASPAQAQREDPALRIARVIARRVSTFENLRALHPVGTWVESPRNVWSVRRSSVCLDELRALGVPHRAWRAMPDPVPAPVKITGAIRGVVFRKARREAPLFTSCEMAVRLPLIADVVRRHGVTHVDVMSAYRREPPQSFHVMGLALDLSVFHRDGLGDALDVERDFEIFATGPTCRAPRPAAPRARALFEIACALSESRRFSSVITPNYDEGHRNHFHLDARPDDPRFFTR